VTVTPGASFFDSALSFALVRGGRLDFAFLGALEVDAQGNLANWIIPGKFAPGIGGGMELAQKARRLVVTITHTTRTGQPKIIEACTLPLTARACVDTIITELAVIDSTADGLMVRELAEGVDFDQVQAKTGAKLSRPAGDLPVFS
jgi:3-oxoacid CoA-transferase B subunit